MYLRWALRELWRNKRISAFFILNMALGLTGFIAIESYKSALQTHLQENKKQILGADVAVYTRREFTEDEMRTVRATVPVGSQELGTSDFFAMLSLPKGARLGLISSVDAGYPFYGSIELEDGSPMRVEPGGIWCYSEFKKQLGVQLGDKVKVGKLELTVRGFVVKDPTETFRSGSFAPRAFIHNSQLADSGLIQFGSTFTRTMLFKIPAGSDSGVVRKALYDKITDNRVRVETPDSEGDNSARQLNYLSDYLGLVALVALFLAGLGTAYIYRLFLQQRMKEIAIYRSLGLQRDQTLWLYVLQASLLAVFALPAAVIGAQILFPFLNKLLSSLMTFDLQPVIRPRSVGLGLLLSLGTSLLVSLPFLWRLRELKPSRLFSEDRFSGTLDIRRPWLFLPAAGALWLLAVLQSKSLFIGSLFAGALAGVLLLLTLLGWLLLRGLENSTWKGPWPMRFSLRGAGRRKGGSLAVFLALALGTLLMNLLPQLKSSLQAELHVGKDSKVPSLFMFDIQDEQVDPLTSIVAERGLPLTGLSPLIRSRLLKVNGSEFERASEEGTFKSREEEQDARFRNRGINLSYRDKLSDSETLIDGRDFTGRFDPASGKKAELSVEERYAERMGLKMGDVLLFDVQGVEVEGEVVSLRRIHWTSFQPNFFVLIQPGALDDAPKTWIAGVPQVDEATRDALQTELAAKFTNVSIVDVARAVGDVLDLSEQMSWSLELMAALALLTGAVVLYSVVRSQVRERRWEINLLKILGASPAEIRRYVLSEFILLTAAASVLGALLSILVGGVLVHWIFRTAFGINGFWPIITCVGTIFLGVAVAAWAARAVLNEKALPLLREG